MITVKESIMVPTAHLSMLSADPSSLLFFDIETTGFQPASNCVYEIGLAYAASAGWMIRQYLIQSPEEEALLLRTFSAVSRPYPFLASFNGDTFDIPFLEARYKKYAMEPPFSRLQSIDMYHEIRKYKAFLGTHSLKQKTLEELAGFERTDNMNGKELIEVFKSYCRTRDPQQEALLLLHNHDDIAGMFTVASFYAFSQLLDGRYTIRSAKILQKDKNRQLQIDACLPLPLPSSLSIQGSYGMISGEGTNVTFVLSMKENCCRYYPEDYKNYFYLPAEDMAVHKLIGTYVDPKYRVRANRSNCYTWWQVTPEKLSDHVSLKQLCDSVIRCAQRNVSQE